MGLLEEVRSNQEGLSPGPRCWYVKVAEGLDPDDLKELDEALADTSIFGSTISRVLTARGFRVQETAVNRHRHGRCLCGR
jgi:hypothetical protein